MGGLSIKLLRAFIVSKYHGFIYSKCRIQNVQWVSVGELWAYIISTYLPPEVRPEAPRLSATLDFPSCFHIYC